MVVSFTSDSAWPLPKAGSRFMSEEDDEFWRRTTQREQLETLRRDKEARHARGWKRNLTLVVLTAILLACLLVFRK